MLWTIAVILIVLWLLGLVSSYTLGGFIHVLLAVALIVFLIQVIQGRAWDELDRLRAKGAPERPTRVSGAALLRSRAHAPGFRGF
jgi:hypothetical protein